MSQRQEEEPPSPQDNTPLKRIRDSDKELNEESDEDHYTVTTRVVKRVRKPECIECNAKHRPWPEYEGRCFQCHMKAHPEKYDSCACCRRVIECHDICYVCVKWIVTEMGKMKLSPLEKKSKDEPTRYDVDFLKDAEKDDTDGYITGEVITRWAYHANGGDNRIFAKGKSIPNPPNEFQGFITGMKEDGVTPIYQKLTFLPKYKKGFAIPTRKYHYMPKSNMSGYYDHFYGVQDSDSEREEEERRELEEIRKQEPPVDQQYSCQTAPIGIPIGRG